MSNKPLAKSSKTNAEPKAKAPKSTKAPSSAKASAKSASKTSKPSSAKTDSTKKSSAAKTSTLKAADAKSEQASKSELVSDPNATTATSAKLIATLKIIENISRTLGLRERDRINFDIEQISERELKVRIVNGEANFKTPWFAIKNEEPYIFMPAEILDVVFRMLKNAQKESFELRLERSIWQHVPIDFADVWRVAMEELSTSGFKKEPDLDKLIDKIKREHPNLFVDMAAMMGQD